MPTRLRTQRAQCRQACVRAERERLRVSAYLRRMLTYAGVCWRMLTYAACVRAERERLRVSAYLTTHVTQLALKEAGY